VIVVNLEYVRFYDKPETHRLKTLEAELDRIRRVRERLARKEARLLVEILRIRRRLMR